MLQIKKLNLTHKKDLRIILNDFNLVLNDGDKAVIIGEEGNGKSTLMKWIYNPSLVENYIEADGERIMGHERLGYLPQEMLDEDKEKTIYEYFSEEEIFWEKTPKELSVIAGKFGMKNDFFYSNQTMGSLSGGEKVKTQLMRLSSHPFPLSCVSTQSELLIRIISGMIYISSDLSVGISTIDDGMKLGIRLLLTILLSGNSDEDLANSSISTTFPFSLVYTPSFNMM